MQARPNTSCRTSFREVGILTLYSQYLLSMIMFTVKNRHLFTSNETIHNIDMRQKADLHVPAAKLTKVQRGVYYSGTALYIALPKHIKGFAHNVKKLKQELEVSAGKIVLFCKGIS